MGFGLNVAAPDTLIMKSIVKAVLSQAENIKKATSAYIDNFYINEDIASVNCIAEHLSLGLTSKDLEEGWCPMVKMWQCNFPSGRALEGVTRKKGFSFCGRLVGHLPICGWLQVMIGIIKQRGNAMTKCWDYQTNKISLKRMLIETGTQMKQADPFKGKWCVDGREFTMWVDASSLVTGITMESDGSIVKDAC